MLASVADRLLRMTFLLSNFGITYRRNPLGPLVDYLRPLKVDKHAWTQRLNFQSCFYSLGSATWQTYKMHLPFSCCIFSILKILCFSAMLFLSCCCLWFLMFQSLWNRISHGHPLLPTAITAALIHLRVASSNTKLASKFQNCVSIQTTSNIIPCGLAS